MRKSAADAHREVSSAVLPGVCQGSKGLNHQLKQITRSNHAPFPSASNTTDFGNAPQPRNTLSSPKAVILVLILVLVLVLVQTEL